MDENSSIRSDSDSPTLGTMKICINVSGLLREKGAL